MPAEEEEDKPKSNLDVLATAIGDVISSHAKTDPPSLLKSPLGAASLTVCTAAVISVVTYVLQARASLEQERLKSESALVLKAVETGDQEKATRNLLFLVKAGFIKDPDGRIKALADVDQGPVLPSPNRASLPAESPTVYRWIMPGTDLYCRTIVGNGLQGTVVVNGTPVGPESVKLGRGSDVKKKGGLSIVARIVATIPEVSTAVLTIELFQKSQLDKTQEVVPMRFRSGCEFAGGSSCQIARVITLE